MPLDTNIAMGFRQPEFENPVNQFGKLLALKHAQSQNAMSEYQLNAARRGDAEAEALRAKFQELSMLPGGFDPNKPEHVNAIVAVSPDKGAALVKHFGDLAKERALMDKTRTETIKTKQEIAAQGMREMVVDPSDENVKRNVARMVEQGVFTPQQAAESEKHLLSMSAPERVKHWQMKGASAKEVQEWTASKPLLRKDGQKEWYVEGNPNRDDFGKEVKALPTVQHVADPNAVLSSKTQERGQDLSARTQERGQDITAKTAANKLAAETDPKVQGSLAAARERAQLTTKAQHAAQQELPKVLAVGEQAIKDVDELLKHPGFNSAVGATLKPGARFVHGTPEAGFMARFNQSKGGAFLTAYETLKGGGQITEVEGVKATDALNRMSIATSEKEFLAAARDYQAAIRRGFDILKAKAGAGTWEEL